MRPYTNTYNTPNSNTLPKFFKFCTMRYIILILVLLNFINIGISKNIEPGCDDPNNLIATAITHNSVTISWDSIVNELDKSFIVELYKVGDPLLVFSYFNLPFSKLKINGLYSNTTYIAKVKRRCITVPTNGGESYVFFSNIKTVTFTTQIQISALCDPGTLFNFSDSTTNTLLLSWQNATNNTAPLSAYGRRYIVHYEEANTGNNKATATIINGDQYNFTGLKSNTKYKFKIFEAFDGYLGQFTYGCNPRTIYCTTRGIDCPTVVIKATCEDSLFLTLSLSPPATSTFEYNIFSEDSVGNKILLVKSNVGNTLLVPKNLMPNNSFEIKWCTGFNNADSTSSNRSQSICSYNYQTCNTGTLGFVYNYMTGKMTNMNNDLKDADCDQLANICDADDDDGPCGDIDGDGIINKLDTLDTVNPYDLPTLNCNTPNNNNITPTTPLLNSLRLGKKLDIMNLPLVPLSVKGALTSSPYSGKGNIKLPFTDKTLSIEFNNITVDTQYHIRSGTIEVLGTGINTLANVTGGVLRVGNVKFCGHGPKSGTEKEIIAGFDNNCNVIKPPYEGWKEGDPYDSKYDENGFDCHGVYISGGMYNYFGCNAEGKNAKGEPCNNNGKPYEWQNTNTSNSAQQTPEGLLLAKKYEANIDSIILAQLKKDSAFYRNKADSVYSICDTYRTEMLTKAKALNYDTTFIYGQSNKLIGRRMHQ
jgi:Fibronectin type III domain